MTQRSHMTTKSALEYRNRKWHNAPLFNSLPKINSDWIPRRCRVSISSTEIEPISAEMTQKSLHVTHAPLLAVWHRGDTHFLGEVRNGALNRDTQWRQGRGRKTDRARDQMTSCADGSCSGGCSLPGGDGLDGGSDETWSARGLIGGNAMRGGSGILGKTPGGRGGGPRTVDEIDTS